MKRFLLLLLLTPAALGATYNVALPGGGVLTVNGLPYVNPGITNSASVVWGVDGTGLLYATATGTNSSIVYVEGAAVAGPNFGLSTEIDPAVTASTNITFSLVNSSITTNKIDSTFYALLMQTGAGDVTQAGNNTFTGTNIFQSSTTISNLTVDALEANSLTLNTPIGVTAVGTNAADARTQLSVAYDVDVQAYRLQLLQAALALIADGHMIYHNGTLVTNLTSTSPGRYLLTATTATDQRNSLVVGELNQTVYSAAWDGVTNKTPTLDAIYDWGQALPGGSNAITSVTAPLALSNGVLSIDTSGLGGGGSGGFVYILTNSLGTYIASDTATNWPIIDTTISSNDLPTAVGKFIEGAFGAVTTNNSGTTSTNYFTVKVNGSTVFRDFAASSASAVNGVKAYAGNFWLIYESTNTASLICFGGSPTAVAAEYGTGDFGINMTAVAFAATNIPVSWSTNLALSIAIENPTTVSTPAANGMRRIFAWMRRDGTNTTAGTGDVVGPASSTDSVVALYDGATGKLLKNGTLTEATIKNATNLTAGTLSSNLLPADVSFTTAGIGTITATTVTGDGSGLTNINGSNIASGTVAAARVDTAIARTNAPTLTSPTLSGTVTINDTLTMEQATLAAHSAVTNFVADPTVAPYQTINADLTTAFTGVRFLHATNVAAGRQTTVLVFAGTNAAVSVALNSQFAFNTNLVSLTTGQVLPVSFYGYGSSPTNVVATVGTIYTR